MPPRLLIWRLFSCVFSSLQKLTTTGGTPHKPCLLLGREYYMVANLITTGKWIISDKLTVAEMVDEVLVRFGTLDPRRKYMFIEWLQAHGGKVKNTANVCEGLTTWLESMQQENIQWEYRLIMDEIDWWGNLDEQALTKIMLADLARNGVQ